MVGKTGKVKVSLYEGALKLSELYKIEDNEIILPLVIIIDKEYLNNSNFIINLDSFMNMVLTYYNGPQKDEETNILYTRISIEKLSKLFFYDRIFLDKLILKDKTEKQINYMSFGYNDFVLGFINKKDLFRRSTENISIEALSLDCLNEYLDDTIKDKLEERPEVTLYEIYDMEECISVFFDTKEELGLYVNASGCNGKEFKLEFFYNKDGINNVVKETSSNGEISYYRIIDEETCVHYSINGESIEYLAIDLLYWPITEVLKSKGISFEKDKSKVKK